MEITTAFEGLKNQAQRLQPVRFVPVYIDPNTRNLLLTDERLLLIDWDGILLSDPMRDVGLLLWWYVSQHHWPDFFQGYGSAMDDQGLAVKRAYLRIWNTDSDCALNRDPVFPCEQATEAAPCVPDRRVLHFTLRIFCCIFPT